MTPYGLSEACWFADCTPSQKLVLLCISWHAKPGGGGAYPGVRRIAKLTGLSRSTTENALAALIGRRYISIVQRGSQVAANEYKINVATLLENGIAPPEMRPRPVPVTGTGVSLSPGLVGVPATGTGVPEGVPIRDGGVSLSAGEGVPMAGTEQRTTPTEQQNGATASPSPECLSLWLTASGLLRKRLGEQLWGTWIRPLKAVGLQAGVLTLILPSADFEHVSTAERYGVIEALRSASDLIGVGCERLITVCQANEAPNESSREFTSYAPPVLRPTPSRRSAKKWL